MTKLIVGGHQSDTHQKALRINLDPRWYGTIAEIGPARKWCTGSSGSAAPRAPSPSPSRPTTWRSATPSTARRTGTSPYGDVPVGLAVNGVADRHVSRPRWTWRRCPRRRRPGRTSAPLPRQPDLRDRPVPARVKVHPQRLLMGAGLMPADDELGHVSPARSPCPAAAVCGRPRQQPADATVKRWDCTDFRPDRRQREQPWCLFWFARQAPITPQAGQTRPLAPSLIGNGQGTHHDPFGRRHPCWRGTGSLVTGIAGAGWRAPPAGP